MSAYVLDLEAVGPKQVSLVGGKGAHLGALSRLEGVRVPAGFCVTTSAFERCLNPRAHALLDRLSGLNPQDVAALLALGAELRDSLQEAPLPDELAAAITLALSRHGEHAAYAVRSSATTEDAPTASFAGQHDTFLNVRGPTAILKHVQRCFASLYSDRALTYRAQHRPDLDPREARMAVVVQRMVAARASGVLFTADPVSGNRRVAVVEATLGLGEALVAGHVDPDAYKVRDGVIVHRRIAGEPVLTDVQVLALVALGRRVEARFGGPQDIEWCLADGDLHLVQARPITSLFPIPAAPDDAPRVYLSVGHQQMMTDPMRPLGLSLFQLSAGRPMVEAGGRLFVDVTAQLTSSTSRAALLDLVGRSDPCTRDALETLLARDFLPPLADPAPAQGPPATPPEPPEPDPTLVTEQIARCQASLDLLERAIEGKTGEALLDFLFDDLQELKRVLFDPQSHRLILAAMGAAWWLDEHLRDWLGEQGAADTLTRSVPHNVTSEMGLALLDVADTIRPHPQVLAALQHAQDQDSDSFLDELPALPGGREARDAIVAWLDRFGMRGVGEIDITRPRWRERPSQLLPLLLSHVRTFPPGEAARRFQEGQEQARRKEQELLQRLRLLPDGEAKAAQTQRQIAILRTFIGFREYPKYGMIRRYGVYKQALLGEARRLVQAGVLPEEHDVYWLTVPELRDVVRTGHVDPAVLHERRSAFRTYQAMRPPRVLTSEGEGLSGAIRREDAPPDALLGVPVSAGTVEGRARVLFNLAGADLEPGDILVTPYTDPSWTPVFVAIGGLVTEVGGQMTHGAVIARELGLPAVVGVDQATRRIRDGQRIRVHGTAGYVELISP